LTNLLAENRPKTDKHPSPPSWNTTVARAHRTTLDTHRSYTHTTEARIRRGWPPISSSSLCSDSDFIEETTRRPHHSGTVELKPAYAKQVTPRIAIGSSDSDDELRRGDAPDPRWRRTSPPDRPL
jgi:hypothetical protein